MKRTPHHNGNFITFLPSKIANGFEVILSTPTETFSIGFMKPRISDDQINKLGLLGNLPQDQTELLP